jgi:hypothetical protein
LLSANTVDYNALHQWSQSIPALIKEDEKRIDKLINKSYNTTSEVRQHFYAIANMPLQSVCTVGKFFGGQWLSSCGGFDGNKYVCLDHFYKDVKNGNCLIYSFGIAGDWTFEEAMAELGCTIRAFDPTIEADTKPKSNLVSVYFIFKAIFFLFI